jgi:hypothetical protein
LKQLGTEPASDELSPAQEADRKEDRKMIIKMVPSMGYSDGKNAHVADFETVYFDADRMRVERSALSDVTLPREIEFGCTNVVGVWPEAAKCGWLYTFCLHRGDEERIVRVEGAVTAYVMNDNGKTVDRIDIN